MKMQKLFLYIALLLLSMSCSLELPENIKSLKPCIKATGITVTPQSLILSDSTGFTFSLSLTGTTSDIAKVVWVLYQNSTEYSGDITITISPFSVTIPEGDFTIKAQIVDKCGSSYNLTSNIRNIRISRKAILMLLRVEGGEFQMGNSANGISDVIHKVTLSSFNISKYEITQAQWRSVMGANPSSNFTNCDDCPVESVSWEDVQLFLTKLNLHTGKAKAFRLPTEAEWEYAARGGNLSKGYIYSGSSTIDDVAWYDANSGFKTHPVGQKTPNELGIYDMTGNVWEWCQDWYGEYAANNQTNPTGAIAGSKRIIRGSSMANPPNIGQLDVPVRNSAVPTLRGNDLGFRVVLSQ